MRYKNKFTEISELAKPIVDYLKENYNPHCEIVIGFNSVKVVQVIVSIPEQKDAQ